MKKSPRHFLSGSDLSKSAVFLRVQIDLQCLFIGADVHLRVHTNSVAAVCDRRKLQGVCVRRLISYSRTGSALFAGSQPRRLLGKAA